MWKWAEVDLVGGRGWLHRDQSRQGRDTLVATRRGRANFLYAGRSCSNFMYKTFFFIYQGVSSNELIYQGVVRLSELFFLKYASK